MEQSSSTGASNKPSWAFDTADGNPRSKAPAEKYRILYPQSPVNEDAPGQRYICARIFLVLVNILFFAVGLVAVLTSIVVATKPEKCAICHSVLNYLLVFGLVTFVIAALGVYGAVSNSYKTLLVYVTLVAFLFMAQLVVFFWSLFGRANFQRRMHTMFRDKMRYHPYQLIEFLDVVQRRLPCCGVDGPLDYHHVGLQLPLSCCFPSGGDQCAVQTRPPTSSTPLPMPNATATAGNGTTTVSSTAANASSIAARAATKVTAAGITTAAPVLGHRAARLSEPEVLEHEERRASPGAEETSTQAAETSTEVEKTSTRERKTSSTAEEISTEEGKMSTTAEKTLTQERKMSTKTEETSTEVGKMSTKNKKTSPKPKQASTKARKSSTKARKTSDKKVKTSPKPPEETSTETEEPPVEVEEELAEKTLTQERRLSPKAGETSTEVGKMSTKNKKTSPKPKQASTKARKSSTKARKTPAKKVKTSPKPPEETSTETEEPPVEVEEELAEKTLTQERRLSPKPEETSTEVGKMSTKNKKTSPKPKQASTKARKSSTKARKTPAKKLKTSPEPPEETSTETEEPPVEVEEELVPEDEEMASEPEMDLPMYKRRKRSVTILSAGVTAGPTGTPPPGNGSMPVLNATGVLPANSTVNGTSKADLEELFNNRTNLTGGPEPWDIHHVKTLGCYGLLWEAADRQYGFTIGVTLAAVALLTLQLVLLCTAHRVARGDFIDRG